MQKLNFPTSSIYDIITRDGSEMILDSLRQKYVVLTHADLLECDAKEKALLMGECKAPEIKITQQVFDQIGRYNTVVQAAYLIATNGLQHYCCAIDRKNNSYRFIDTLPRYGDIA